MCTENLPRFRAEYVYLRYQWEGPGIEPGRHWLAGTYPVCTLIIGLTMRGVCPVNPDNKCHASHGSERARKHWRPVANRCSSSKSTTRTAPPSGRFLAVESRETNLGPQHCTGNLPRNSAVRRPSATRWRSSGTHTPAVATPSHCVSSTIAFSLIVQDRTCPTECLRNAGSQLTNYRQVLSRRFDMLSTPTRPGILEINDESHSILAGITAPNSIHNNTGVSAGTRMRSPVDIDATRGNFLPSAGSGSGS